MVTELLPHLEDVLFVGHSGVVVKLTEAGLKNTSQQSEILKALLKAFHADKDAKCCVPLFLTITAYEVYSKHREKMKNDKSLARVGYFTYCTSEGCLSHLLYYRSLLPLFYVEGFTTSARITDSASTAEV